MSIKTDPVKKKKKKNLTSEGKVKKKKKKKIPKAEETIAGDPPKEKSPIEIQREKAEKISREERAFRQLQYMKRRDLLAACISRGMPFEMSYVDTPRLSGWFTDHLDNSQDLNLLTEYDIWREQQLLQRGIKKGDALLHPDLCLGVSGDISTMSPNDLKKSIKSPTTIKLNKPSKSESTRPRGQKDESGIQAGTKKALTFKLAKAGKSLEEVTELVAKEFGKENINAKSMKIWFNKAIKQK